MYGFQVCTCVSTRRMYVYNGLVMCINSVRMPRLVKCAVFNLKVVVLISATPSLANSIHKLLGFLYCWPNAFISACVAPCCQNMGLFNCIGKLSLMTVFLNIFPKQHPVIQS